MIRILIGVLVLVFLAALLRLAWLRAQGNARAFLLAVALGGAIALVLLAVASGRLNWLFTIPAVLLPFASRIARLLRWTSVFGGGGPTPMGPPAGGTRGSSIETRCLRMELDHASGAMDGEIRVGEHSGRRLSELTPDELLALLDAWRSEDPDAARLLETWLERTQGPQWRERESGRHGNGRGQDAGRPGRAEALAVLGLSGSPDRDTIVRAHRRLMQQFHPDHGGTDHLAAQINQARDRLLEDLESP